MTFLQPRDDMRVALLSQLHHDPAPAHLVGNSTSLPEPAKESRTQSPGWVDMPIMRLISASGFLPFVKSTPPSSPKAGCLNVLPEVAGMDGEVIVANSNLMRGCALPVLVIGLDYVELFLRCLDNEGTGSLFYNAALCICRRFALSVVCDSPDNSARRYPVTTFL